MLKGILAFFTSGAFLNPMVLSGVVLGFILNFTMSYDQIYDFYTNYNLYLFALFISTAYSFGYKREYKLGGKEIDYLTNSLSAIGGAIKFVFSSYLTLSFIMMMSF
ncbi:MAG: hypothetical protein ACK5N8_05290 [Alphaproteobacteria bacterium]